MPTATSEVGQRCAPLAFLGSVLVMFMLPSVHRYEGRHNFPSALESLRPRRSTDLLNLRPVCLHPTR